MPTGRQAGYPAGVNTEDLETLACGKFLFYFYYTFITMKKHLLRTLLLIVVYCQLPVAGKAQWVSIPDTVFGAWLDTSGYSTCMQGDNTVGWQMDTTCSAVVNATTLSCAYKHIKNLSGIEYFDHLDTLICNDNSVISFSILTPLLRYLNCSNNGLTSLTTLPASLTWLDYSMNPLISALTLPTSLLWLNCSYNQLLSLPVLPASLTTLACLGNQLTSLPTLPPSLHALYCGGNQITSLPVLPPSLLMLYCEYNQLLSLPVLPASLQQLGCYNNPPLGNIPALPSSINRFQCNSLPLLTVIPELPDSLVSLNVSFCPNLTCLPKLKKVSHFYFNNSGISCLPNYPKSNSSSNPLLSTVPICDMFNINSCPVYWNIGGKVYIDDNSNCVYDAGENVFPNFKIQLYQNGILQQQENTLGDGHYSFNTNLGIYTYSIDTTNLPLSIACPDSGYYTSNIIALDSFDADMNFGLRCKSGFDLAAESVYGWGFRPASNRLVNISAGDLSNFYGQHCAAGVSGEVTVTITGPAHYSSPAVGSLTPSSISGNTITYNIADFGTIDFYHAFNIWITVDTTAVLGSQICFTVSVTPTAGDNNLPNNTLTQCFIVLASCDPNEKEVYPVGGIDGNNAWLTYTIRFQNTGTDTAQHIYVTDTLSQYVDESSFQLLAYSHQPMVQIKENAVRFNFPNINLPDSNTNEAASHGYVQYKVKLKDNLPVGTNIDNTAFIYFDFNSPVVTNTVSNTISTITNVAEFGMQNAEFGMNPNPANSFVNISMEEKMIGSNFAITDITGRRMICVTAVNSAFRIPTSALSNGVYFVTVENERGRVTRKLVIQK